MKTTWPMVPLAQFARPVERVVNVEPEGRYRTIGVKWWGEGAYERETVDGTRTAAKTLSFVQKDDLIINKIWVRHGSTAIAAPEVDGCAASGEFPTFTLDREQAMPQWLHWLSKTPWFWSQCDHLSQGTSGKNRIQPERFLTIAVPLPSLPEQQRIVARIEEIASRIISALRLQEEVDGELAAFVSSLHVQMASGREVGVGTFLELHEEQEVIVSEHVYPQVGIRGFGGGLFAKSAVAGKDTTYKFFNRLFDGALVLSQVKGWEGAIGLSDQRMAGWYVSPEYRTFRCVPGQADPDYLRHLVANQWFWKHLKSLSRGVGARRERTRPEQFLALRMLMPIVERQQQAAQTLDRITCIPSLRATAELQALLRSILDKALRGEL